MTIGEPGLAGDVPLVRPGDERLEVGEQRLVHRREGERRLRLPPASSAGEQPSSRSGQVTIGIRKKLTCFDAGFTNANQSWAFAPARRRVGML